MSYSHCFPTLIATLMGVRAHDFILCPQPKQMSFHAGYKGPDKINIVHPHEKTPQVILKPQYHSIAEGRMSELTYSLSFREDPNSKPLRSWSVDSGTRHNGSRKGGIWHCGRHFSLGTVRVWRWKEEGLGINLAGILVNCR